MHRITVKIDKWLYRPTASRTSTTEDKYSPEVMVVVQGDNTLAALDKAIRLLTSERDAIRDITPPALKPSRKIDPSDDEDEEDDRD